MSNSTFPTCNALSSSQTEMDGERDLQRNQFNGSKMGRTESLQHVFPSLQEHVPDNYKRLLESQSRTNNCSISSGKTRSQTTYDHTSTEDRSVQFPSRNPPSKSESRSDASERNVLGSWQLLRNEYMDASKSSEAQYTNSDSHNKRGMRNSSISLPKLQNVPCQLLDQLRDELHDFTERKNQQFLDASLREHLAQNFGITQILPLYLDRSEFVMWFLDENKCLLLWNEMGNNVIYMGSDLEEGITNYLIHPDRLCYVTEDTFERVPINEKKRQLDEKCRKHMEAIGFEKMLLEADAILAASKAEKARKKLSKRLSKKLSKNK